MVDRWTPGEICLMDDRGFLDVEKLKYLLHIYGVLFFIRTFLILCSIPFSLDVNNSLNSSKSYGLMLLSSYPFRLDSSLKAPPYN